MVALLELMSQVNYYSFESYFKRNAQNALNMEMIIKQPLYYEIICVINNDVMIAPYDINFAYGFEIFLFTSI